MERGLIWLPLLGLFFWLAWAGKREYQKVEAYRNWASEFDRAKYDIYAVLGQKGDNLTMGKPTRFGPVDLKTFSLKDVQSIRLLANNQPVDLEHAPTSGKAALEFLFQDTESVQVPFTEVALAVQWAKFLNSFS
jgi:hypothetical protein